MNWPSELLDRAPIRPRSDLDPAAPPVELMLRRVITLQNEGMLMQDSGENQRHRQRARGTLQWGQTNRSSALRSSASDPGNHWRPFRLKAPALRGEEFELKHFCKGFIHAQGSCHLPVDTEDPFIESMAA